MPPATQKVLADYAALSYEHGRIVKVIVGPHAFALTHCLVEMQDEVAFLQGRSEHGEEVLIDATRITALIIKTNSADDSQETSKLGQ